MDYATTASGRSRKPLLGGAVEQFVSPHVLARLQDKARNGVKP